MKRWGESVSLVRKEWKTRGENDGGIRRAICDRADRDDEMAVDDEEGEEEEEEEEPDLEARYPDDPLECTLHNCLPI